MCELVLAPPQTRVLSPVRRTLSGDRLWYMLLRRVPFTAAAIATMLLVGVISGALFTRVSDHRWGDDIATVYRP
jgi:hypothetical protein